MAGSNDLRVRMEQSARCGTPRRRHGAPTNPPSSPLALSLGSQGSPRAVDTARRLIQTAHEAARAVCSTMSLARPYGREIGALPMGGAKWSAMR